MKKQRIKIKGKMNTAFIDAKTSGLTAFSKYMILDTWGNNWISAYCIFKGHFFKTRNSRL